jgi:hypothetical protein
MDEVNRPDSQEFVCNWVSNVSPIPRTRPPLAPVGAEHPATGTTLTASKHDAKNGLLLQACRHGFRLMPDVPHADVSRLNSILRLNIT